MGARVPEHDIKSRWVSSLQQVPCNVVIRVERLTSTDGVNVQRIRLAHLPILGIRYRSPK